MLLLLAFLVYFNELVISCSENPVNLIIVFNRWPPAALTVRFLTRRYIGEYDSKLGKKNKHMSSLQNSIELGEFYARPRHFMTQLDAIPQTHTQPQIVSPIIIIIIIINVPGQVIPNF